MDRIWHLSKNIGERHAGTDNEAMAADYIEKEMSRIGLEAKANSFRFLGWELRREPTLNVLKPWARSWEVKPARALEGEGCREFGHSLCW